MPQQSVLIINHEETEEWDEVDEGCGRDKWLASPTGEYGIKFVNAEKQVALEDLQQWLQGRGQIRTDVVLVFAHESHSKGVASEDLQGFREEYPYSTWKLFHNYDGGIACELIRHYAKGCPPPQQGDFVWSHLQAAVEATGPVESLGDSLAALDKLIQGWSTVLEAGSAPQSDKIRCGTTAKTPRQWFASIRDQVPDILQAMGRAQSPNAAVDALVRIAQAIIANNRESLCDKGLLRTAHEQFLRIAEERQQSEMRAGSLSLKSCGDWRGDVEDRLHGLMKVDWQPDHILEKMVEDFEFVRSACLRGGRTDLGRQIDCGLKRIRVLDGASLAPARFRRTDFTDFDLPWFWSTIVSDLAESKRLDCVAGLHGPSIAGLNRLLEVRELHGILPRRAELSKDVRLLIRIPVRDGDGAVTHNRLLLEEKYCCVNKKNPREACPPVRWQYFARTLAYQLWKIVEEDGRRA